jgi:hypothetical protein
MRIFSHTPPDSMASASVRSRRRRARRAVPALHPAPPASTFRCNERRTHEGRRPRSRLPLGLHAPRLPRGAGGADLPPPPHGHPRPLPHRLPPEPGGRGAHLPPRRREPDARLGEDRRRPGHARDHARWPHLPRPRRAVPLGGRGRDRARSQHRARRALHVARHVLHPVRGPGLPQDHLLPRPPRRHGPLPRPDRGRRPGDAVERQPHWLRPRLGRMARPLAQARLPLRPRRRPLVAHSDRFTTPRAATLP